MGDDDNRYDDKAAQRVRGEMYADMDRTTNNPTPQPAGGDYACNFCDWTSTDTSRPLSRGTKVGCPACEKEARFVGMAQPAGVAGALELKPCPAGHKAQVCNYDEQMFYVV